MRTRLRTALNVVASVACVSAAVAGQSSVPSSQATAFMGTWAFTMTEPAEIKGSQQIVRVWDNDGVVAASFQIGKFPARNVTGAARDGDMLVLTISHKAEPALLENGAPIWGVIALTPDGEMMRSALLLEKSATVKRGVARKQ